MLIIGFVLIAVAVAAATMLIVQNAGQVPDTPAGRPDSPSATEPKPAQLIVACAGL